MDKYLDWKVIETLHLHGIFAMSSGDGDAKREPFKGHLKYLPHNNVKQISYAQPAISSTHLLMMGEKLGSSISM